MPLFRKKIKNVSEAPSARVGDIFCLQAKISLIKKDKNEINALISQQERRRV